MNAGKVYHDGDEVMGYIVSRKMLRDGITGTLLLSLLFICSCKRSITIENPILPSFPPSCSRYGTDHFVISPVYNIKYFGFKNAPLFPNQFRFEGIAGPINNQLNITIENGEPRFEVVGMNPFVNNQLLSLIPRWEAGNNYTKFITDVELRILFKGQGNNGNVQIYYRNLSYNESPDEFTVFTIPHDRARARYLLPMGERCEISYVGSSSECEEIYKQYIKREERIRSLCD